MLKAVAFCALLLPLQAVAETTCTNTRDMHVHPCVDLSHMAIGALVGGLVAYKYGPKAGMYSVLIFGFTKEAVDYTQGKKFYVRDIVTRTIGGVVGIQIAIELK